MRERNEETAKRRDGDKDRETSIREKRERQGVREMAPYCVCFLLHIKHQGIVCELRACVVTIRKNLSINVSTFTPISASSNDGDKQCTWGPMHPAMMKARWSTATTAMSLRGDGMTGPSCHERVCDARADAYERIQWQQLHT